jgi:4-diphosphocytidyl-2-C-methyl-D-erythritol kinase
MTINAHAKVNIFLKITGIRDGYHEIASRFVQVPSLFDTLSFQEEEVGSFSLYGDFDCALENNTIYKAYQALIHFNETIANKVTNFFSHHSVHVQKRIPSFAGLGGGSSDAGAFLRLTNETLALNIPIDDLATIGANVGADVAFFVYNYHSANVSGIGEIVEAFDEPPLNITTITPPSEQCNTKAVYEQFRENYFKTTSIEDAQELFSLNSRDIINIMSAYDANDLLRPALHLYPELKIYLHHNRFFSGSGSTFFEVQE